MTTTPTLAIDEVVELLKTLRLPHMRRNEPDVLATAKAQRWEPAEAIRAFVGRGTRRPQRLVDQHPPGRRRVPHREDLRAQQRPAVHRMP